MLEAEGELYIVGCRTPGEVMAGNQTSAFTFAPALASVRATVSHGGFSFGGASSPVKNAQCSTHFARYDKNTNTWKQLPPLSKARDHSAMAYHRGYIYVIGGWIGDSFCGMVERYCIETQTWQTCASLKFPKGYVAVSPKYGITVLVHKDHVLVSVPVKQSSHAYSECCVLMAFDPATNVWSTSIPNMADTINYPLVLDDMLYLVHFQAAPNNTGTLDTFKPIVQKYKCVSGIKPSLYFEKIGEVTQKGIPEHTGLYAFHVNRDVYIILGRYVYKTNIQLNDDVYDVSLKRYAGISFTRDRVCVEFTLARRYFKQATMAPVMGTIIKSSKINNTMN